MTLVQQKHGCKYFKFKADPLTWPRFFTFGGVEKHCDERSYIRVKSQTEFHRRVNNYKSKHQPLRKRKQNVQQNRFHTHR